MFFDGSQGAAFLRDVRDMAAPSTPTSVSPVSPKPSKEDQDQSELENNQFLDELLAITKGITDNKELFSGLAKDVLLAILRQSFENEKLSDDLEFNEEDVMSMVDFMNEQMHNLVRMLTDKSKQCRFSHMTVQYPYSLWAESPSQLRATKAILPLILPGERSLQKIKSQNRCDDGEDIKAVQMLAS